MIADPIFIIGTERSGSNLLRLLLNAHPHITIPHPPHVMRDMAPFVHAYGPLNVDANFFRMASDMAKLVNMHFAPWPFPVSGEELMATAEVRSLYGLYVALHERYRRHSSKKRWGCKSTFMFKHMQEIRRHQTAARFLHLVRDPRDVAVSAGQSIFSKYHPYCQARLWRQEQQQIETFSGKDVLRVRYEDLTADPEREMIKIMDFLNEEFHSDQLHFFRGPEALKLSHLSNSWKNCQSPVSAKSVGNFRTRLKENHISWIEHETGALLEHYGYKPISKPKRPNARSRVGIQIADRTRMLSTEAKAFFADQNFSLRWKKWLWTKYLKSVRSIENGWRSGKNQNI